MRKVLCFGDSLTYGYYQGGKKHSYAMSLHSHLLEKSKNTRVDWKVEDRGVSGETTDDMMERLVEDLDNGRYDYVIILGGTNDIGKQVPVKNIINNLRNMYSKVVSTGAKPIAVTIPVTRFDSSYKWLVENRNLVNDFIRNYAKSNNMKLFDLNALIAYDNEASKDLWDDALHFSPKGYDLIGKLLVEMNCLSV